MRRLLTTLAGLFVIGALGFGLVQVFSVERDELEVRSAPNVLRPTQGDSGPEPHQELVRAPLQLADEVVFEICTEDELGRAEWEDAVEFVVWQPTTEELMVRAPTNDAFFENVKARAGGACVVIGRGTAPATADYAIEAVWTGEAPPATIAETQIMARIVATHPLGPAARWAPILLLVGAFLLALVLCWPRRSAEDNPLDPPAELSGNAPEETGMMRSDPAPLDRSSDGRRAPTVTQLGLWLLGALAVLFGLPFLSGLVPIGGATATLLRGLFLGAAEIGLAMLFVRAMRARPNALGLVGPQTFLRDRAGLAIAGTIVAALLIGVGLRFAGGVLQNLLPVTGVAPIQEVVRWPSGALAFALVGVVVPVAEEIFFRGFVFGAVERRLGGASAFVLTSVLFALAHVPQQWGDWGAVAAVALTGTVLTGLRWGTGSLLAPLIAHLTHNGLIIVLSMT